MRIPWIPQEQGGGSHGPTLAERVFVGADGQADYGTATNPVGRKAFMNLPMPTKDAMTIYEPNLHNGPKKGTGLRHKHPEGAGENYVDSFVTHPIAGNYEKLFAVLDEQKKAEDVERVPSLTLEMVAQQGYTNMGLNADEERMNSLRDRLRFMGASDEEIETQLKEARQERVRAMVGRAMIPEAHQLFEADQWAKKMGVHPEQAEQGTFDFGARPSHDGNVFNFGTPAPAHYAGHLSRQGPDASAFLPGAHRYYHEIFSPKILHNIELSGKGVVAFQKIRHVRAGGLAGITTLHENLQQGPIVPYETGKKLRLSPGTASYLHSQQSLKPLPKLFGKKRIDMSKVKNEQNIEEIETIGTQRSKMGLAPASDIKPIFQAIKNRGRGRPGSSVVRPFAMPRPRV